MTKDRVLVAETDDTGHVVCVWVKSRGDRVPHPVRDVRNALDLDGSVEFFGAPADAIRRWLEEHAF